MKGLPVSKAAPRFKLGCSVGLLVFQSLGVRRSVFIPLPDTGLGWTFLISLLPAQTGAELRGRQRARAFFIQRKASLALFFASLGHG